MEAPETPMESEFDGLTHRLAKILPSIDSDVFSDDKSDNDTSTLIGEDVLAKYVCWLLKRKITTEDHTKTVFSPNASMDASFKGAMSDLKSDRVLQYWFVRICSHG